MNRPIRPESFRDLVTSGAVKSATILGQKGGYAVLASVGAEQRPLGTRNGEVRMFSTADTAVRTLRAFGVYLASVDTTNYQEGTLRPGRPDLAKKNRAANAALEHDQWFREQVESTKAKIERGEGQWHTLDDAFAEVKAHAARRMAERGDKE